MPNFDPRSFQEYCRFLDRELTKLERALYLVEKSQRQQLTDIRNQMGNIRNQTTSDLQRIRQYVGELRKLNSN